MPLLSEINASLGGLGRVISSHVPLAHRILRRGIQ